MNADGKYLVGAMPEPCHDADRGLFSREPLKASQARGQTRHIWSSEIASEVCICDKIYTRRHFEASQHLRSLIQICAAKLISRVGVISSSSIENT